MQLDFRSYRLSAPYRSLAHIAAVPRRAGSAAFNLTRAIIDDVSGTAPECAGIMSQHAHTFSFASQFLPASNRASTAYLYAFFRTLDDLVDERESHGLQVDEIRQELRQWRAWISTGGAERCPRPEIGMPFLDVVDRHGIPWRYIYDFLDGLEFDLNEPIRLQTQAELEEYSYRVASTVGISMAYVFGSSSPVAIEAARRLGIAMQLTNVLRDIGGDARRDRVYVPESELNRVGLTHDDLIAQWKSGSGPDWRLKRVIRHQIDVADQHYSAGIDGIGLLPPSVQLPILVAARLYQRILRALEVNDYDSLRLRVATGRAEKVAMALRCTLWEGIPSSTSNGNGELAQ